MKGRFIVIEGIDGAGTTTHAQLLLKHLQSSQKNVHLTREPSDGPVGKFIREILAVRGFSDKGGMRTPSWETMTALFAADRLDHVNHEILPALNAGKHVISDRYDMSSLAYQLLSSGQASGAAEWILALNQRAPRPDLTLVLDVDADVAQQRREERKGNPELYEVQEFQRELAAQYRSIDKFFPKDRIVHLDANRALEPIRVDIVREVSALLS